MYLNSNINIVSSRDNPHKFTYFKLEKMTSSVAHTNETKCSNTVYSYYIDNNPF